MTPAERLAIPVSFKGLGIFPMVDEKCLGMRPKDDKELEGIFDDYKKNEKLIYATSTKRRMQFMIKHSAQDVWYIYSEFIDRDMDYVPDALESICSEMAQTNVRHIYRNVLSQQEEDELNEKNEEIMKLPPR
jgi:myosin heavy subunit